MPDAKTWLQNLKALKLPKKLRVMNVCGGHERTITQAGIRTVLPQNIELIPGPGCPVCVCPEEDIYEAIQLALHEDVMLLSFGDMLRVPVNVGKNEVRSLEQAKAAGADVRAVASPSEAATIARKHPDRCVVFFAAGFETTMAPVAAMIAQGIPGNLYLLLSGRLTWPAVAMLLQSGEPGFDALIAPGHVSTIRGPEEWSFVSEQYHIPTAIAGFTAQTLLQALYSVIHQCLENKPTLDNCYAEVVRPQGNPVANQLLDKVMDVVDSNWRGIGMIPESGYLLRAAYASHDARKQLPRYQDELRKRRGEMPAGCDCAQVVLGKITPPQCRIYGTACTPRHPVGPCMVSDEGACRIWWTSGVKAFESSKAIQQIPSPFGRRLG